MTAKAIWDSQGNLVDVSGAPSANDFSTAVFASGAKQSSGATLVGVALPWVTSLRS